MIQDICREYHCLPSAVKGLTLDQIFILAASRETLVARGSLINTTPQALARRGVINLGEQDSSLFQRIMARKAKQQLTTSARAARRARRRVRRDEIIASRIKETRSDNHG